MANVESVTRGLEILRLLNQQTGQTLTQLSEGSSLPRGTAYRMLYTLENAGFVERLQNRYWITHRVRMLSHGYDDDMTCEVARPIVRELGRSIHWPVTLSEQFGGYALVRETTDGESSLIFEPTKPGFRMSMLDTASGRVLLAYAPQRRQRTLLDYLDCQTEGISAFGRTYARAFDEIASAIRTRGYDVLPVPHGKQTAIAVPIIDGTGHAVAALALRYFNSAMRHTEAVERFVAPLQDCAARINAQLGQRSGALN